MAQRTGKPDFNFDIPSDVVARAQRHTNTGVQIQVTPIELIEAMRKADRCLNDPGDDVEEVLLGMRQILSEWFEDPARRTRFS